MKPFITKKDILNELVRVAGNCQYYKGTGKKLHFINEAGTLRGLMVLADQAGVVYHKLDYYELYIKPAHDMMTA